MIHQHLCERFTLRIDAERRDAPTPERIVQEEIKGVRAGQIEAFDPADSGVSKPIVDRLFS